MSKISELRRYMEYCEEGIAQWGALGEKHVVEWAREEVERLRRYLSSEAAEKPAEPPEVVTLRAEVEKLMADNKRLRWEMRRVIGEREEARTLLADFLRRADAMLSRGKGNDGGCDQAADGEDNTGPNLTGA